MGKLLAMGGRTSQGRTLSKTREFVSSTKEVQGEGTSDRGEIANPDASFFGETLCRDGQG